MRLKTAPTPAEARAIPRDVALRLRALLQEKEAEVHTLRTRLQAALAAHAAGEEAARERQLRLQVSERERGSQLMLLLRSLSVCVRLCGA